MDSGSRTRISLAVLLLLVGLACGPCNLLSGSVPTPSHDIAVSTEAAGQLESRLRQVASGPLGQPFILSMTDDEVTSLLSAELVRYDDSPVQNPTVWFTQGQVHATGRLVNIVPVATDFYLVAQPTVREGKVAVDIIEMSAGALPLPESVLQTVSQSINETVDEMQLGVTVTALEIREGEAIIRGSRE